MAGLIPTHCEREMSTILELWRFGARLGYAWLTFADEHNRKKYSELRRSHEHHGQQRFMELLLQDQLRNNELAAIGIEHGSDAGPAIIPEYYFLQSAKIDLDADTMQSLGKSFHEIRVVKPTALKKLVDAVGRREEDHSSISVPKSRPGRPSKDTEIETAICALRDRGIDLNSMKRSSACEKVREYARDELGANLQIGYSDPPVQRMLVRILGKRV